MARQTAVLAIACTLEDIDPSYIDGVDDVPPDCPHRASYPMGPRWMHCLDCNGWQDVATGRWEGMWE